MKSGFTSLMNSTSYLGSPSINILSNSHCIYPNSFVQKHGTVKIKLLFTSIYPLFFFVVIFVGMFIFYKLKILGIKKYHNYSTITILYTFFQPSLIKLFTMALSCRTIGDNSYVSLNFQIQCNDESYRGFINALVIPYFIFLFIVPIYIGFQLFKHKEKLNYCTTKYKLGYFYLDYKPKYYFWEINKIYFKTFVIAFYTWYNQIDQNFAYQIVSLVICFTIIANTIFKPYMVKKIEVLDSLSRVLILTNIILQQLSQIYSYNLFAILQYLIHVFFVFGVLLIIIRIKVSNMIDQRDGTMIKLLKKWIHKTLIDFIIVKNTNSMVVYGRWKLIQKNITILIKMQAQKIQQICDINTSKLITSKNNKTHHFATNAKLLALDSTVGPQFALAGNRTQDTTLFASQVLNKQGQSQSQTPMIVKNQSVFKQFSESDQITLNKFKDDEVLEENNVDKKIQNIVESENDLDNIQQYDENNPKSNDIKNSNDFMTILKLNNK